MSKSIRGFTLIAALFLLVVVAFLSVYMINFRSVQQSTIVYGLQGARAMQAAQTGIEWGIYDAFTVGCPVPKTSNITASGPALAGFAIEVICTSTSHTEGVIPIITYQLTSTATTTTSTYGSLDYVYRSLRATVSIQPP